VGFKSRDTAAGPGAAGRTRAAELGWAVLPTVQDEPTNHLDLEACVWLEEHLKHFNRILLMVSHSQVRRPALRAAARRPGPATCLLGPRLWKCASQ